MTAHEYLSQVYVLDRKIKYDLRELENLREMSCSISSPNLGERVDGSRSQEVPFVRALERIWEQQDIINEEIKRLEAIKAEIVSEIDKVQDDDERFVLLYRYIQKMKWSDIGLELCMSEKTVRRKHKMALQKFIVPS